MARQTLVEAQEAANAAQKAAALATEKVTEALALMSGSPARQGKKMLSFWVEPEVSVQLRIASVRMSRSVHDIMVEALADWFTKQGLPRLSDRSEAA